MASVMALSACSAGQEKPTPAPETNTPSAETAAPAPAPEVSKEEKAEPITDLVLAKLSSAEMTSLNPVFCSTVAEGEVISNIYDGLIECTNKGEPEAGFGYLLGIQRGCYCLDFQYP